MQGALQNMNRPVTKESNRSDTKSLVTSNSTMDDADDLAVNETALVRKIDWHIVPILFAAYFLQFLDKVIINYANVMGFQKDVGMKGNDFSWMATAFFMGYALAELPQGALIQRFPVSKVLGINVFLWGITIACTAAAKTPAQMIGMRVILGMFESVITPALIMITAAWYKKNEAAPRYGLWYCGLGVGQIIGGLISFGAQHSTVKALSGWRIMFIVIGGCNLIVATLIWFFLPGSPEEAKFLTEEERAFIDLRLRLDQAGVGLKVFRWESLIEAVTDLQTWILALMTVLISLPSGVITTYSSILIRNFGFTSREAALLNMPSGIVSIAFTILSTYVIARGWQRWVSVIACLIPTLIGASLMSFLPKHNQAGLLCGIYLVNATVAPYALILSTCGSNYRGYTRKVTGSAIIAAAFSVANIIGPQTFQARDAPNYYPAKYTVVAVNAGAILCAILLRLLYGTRNKKADQNGRSAMSWLEEKAVKKSPADTADVAWRYVY